MPIPTLICVLISILLVYFKVAESKSTLTLVGPGLLISDLILEKFRE
jgi:hypothetical protein